MRHVDLKQKEELRENIPDAADVCVAPRRKFVRLTESTGLKTQRYRSNDNSASRAE